MASFTVDIRGIKGIEKALNDKVQSVTVGAELEIKASLQNIERSAKRKAPVNFGTLRQSINAKQSGLSGHVEASALYAPYIEFGTGGKVSVPSGYEAFANQFRGSNAKGGTIDEMIDSLTDWVGRKGLAGSYSVKSRRRLGNKARQADENKQLATAIAYRILQNGIAPQPFLIPSYIEEKPNLIKRLQRLLKFK